LGETTDKDMQESGARSGGFRFLGVGDLFGRLMGGMNAIGTIWIFALMVLINADVFGRNALNAPVRGVTEIISLSIVAIVFLQLAHTLRVGRLTRSDALLDWLLRTHPRTAHGLLALFHLTGAGLFLVIFYASLPYFSRAIRIDEYVGAFGDFTAPTWPVRLIILIGSMATTIQFLFLTWADLRKTMGRSS
jgi:TRAP-type mannitol/chloroaromatic compound transport system permease small subunit